MPKEGEGADEQRRHEQEHFVEQGIVGPVERIGVRLVLRELHAHARMALLAGGDDPERGQPGPRVADGENIVVAVAVVTRRDIRGHVGPAEGHGLAVVSLAIVREPVRVAHARNSGR